MRYGVGMTKREMGCKRLDSRSHGNKTIDGLQDEELDSRLRGNDIKENENKRRKVK
jgi:hypothetical protein